MSEFIVAGIIIIAGVNWLYSHFCEGPRQFSRKQKQEMASRAVKVRF